MKTLTFLLSTVIELYTMALLLRVWMQWARCDFYNPFSQFVVKITQPVVGPLRRIIPAMGPMAGIIRRSGPTTGCVIFTTNCENGL